ncbi:MAG: putative toxin-antitoxin system toxin component, PIN family [bacterium]
MRVILDANVLIAAVAGRGLCESLMELCLEDHDIVISQALIDEVRRKLVKKIKLADAVAVEFCSLLRDNSMMTDPAFVPAGACRDPKDLYLLGLSDSAAVDFLITGDKDLIDVGRYGRTMIVTPRQFWETIRKSVP